MALDAKVIGECTRLAFEGTMPFPQVVQRLIGIGVERYDADLVRLEKMYYSGEGETHLEPLPLMDAPAIADEFDVKGVTASIRRIQRGEIIYPQFLHEVMGAGVVSYSVYIVGRKAIYFGRRGEFHVEHFPSGK